MLHSMSPLLTPSGCLETLPERQLEPLRCFSPELGGNEAARVHHASRRCRGAIIVVDTENSDELKARLSSLSPAKRAWLERRLHASLKRGPTGKVPATVIQLQVGNNELPIYVIHAGPGEISLAQTMGVGRSIFGRGRVYNCHCWSYNKSRSN